MNTDGDDTLNVTGSSGKVTCQIVWMVVYIINQAIGILKVGC